MANKTFSFPFHLNNPFQVNVDFDDIRSSYESIKKEYSEYPNAFCGLDDTDHKVTQEEWDKDMEEFKKDIDLLEEKAEQIIGGLVRRAAKKKDGTFKKGSVLTYSHYPATGVYYEDSYGIRYYCIRLKVDDHTKAHIEVYHDIENF